MAVLTMLEAAGGVYLVRTWTDLAPKSPRTAAVCGAVVLALVMPDAAMGAALGGAGAIFVFVSHAMARAGHRQTLKRRVAIAEAQLSEEREAWAKAGSPDTKEWLERFRRIHDDLDAARRAEMDDLFS